MNIIVARTIETLSFVDISYTLVLFIIRISRNATFTLTNAVTFPMNFVKILNIYFLESKGQKVTLRAFAMFLIFGGKMGMATTRAPDSLGHY